MFIVRRQSFLFFIHSILFTISIEFTNLQKYAEINKKYVVAYVYTLLYCAILIRYTHFLLDVNLRFGSKYTELNLDRSN